MVTGGTYGFCVVMIGRRVVTGGGGGGGGLVVD